MTLTPTCGGAPRHGSPGHTSGPPAWQTRLPPPPIMRIATGRARCAARMSRWDATEVTEQIAVRLDDGLAENARAAAAAAGTTLSDWVRSALRRQVALATALRARAEEDARGPLYSAAEEDALMDTRERRALAAFDDPQSDPGIDAGRR